jgi:hypothetical protein
MKRAVIISLVIAGMGAGLWQCTKENGTGSSLKESLNLNSARLDKALNVISNSSAYRMLLAETGGTMKSASPDTVVYLDSIRLGDISGIYEFEQPDSMAYYHHGLYRMFRKTGESDNLVVKLPESKLFHPRKLWHPFERDTIGPNNFVITASEYHYYFAYGFVYDYGLNAGFELNDSLLGYLGIQSYRNSWSDFQFSSSYTFPEGYTIKVDQNSGDTSTFSMALLEGSDILLQESIQKTKHEGQRQHERQYSLTIGNVQITRSSTADSMLVYLDGALQPNAKVEIIDTGQDNGDEMHSVRHSRDIQITFEDGTVTTVSDLLGPSKEILSGLVDSLGDMSFATRILDYIAWNIYIGNTLE